jgi:hypothetical protein
MSPLESKTGSRGTTCIAKIYEQVIGVSRYRGLALPKYDSLVDADEPVIGHICIPHEEYSRV